VSMIEPELSALAAHLRDRREAILHGWRRAVKRDPDLTSFEHRLDPRLEMQTPEVLAAAVSKARAHGLHRWQQGYALMEVSRELGRLNECVVVELEDYSRQRPELPHDVMATARRMWAELSALEFSESVAEYFRLQQAEAAGHINDLE
jgi:hypothetical protein